MWGTRATGPLTIPAFLPPDWPTRGSSLLNLEPGPLPTQAAALTTGPSHGLLHGPASPGVGLSHPHLPSFRLSRPQQGTCSARTPPPPPRLLIHSRWTCPFPWDPSLSLHFSPAHQRICTAPPEPPVVTVRFAPATHLLRVSSLNEPFPSYRLVICTSNTSSLTSPFWGLLA